MSEVDKTPTQPSSNQMTLDEAIRRIGLKMEVRKRDPWSDGQVMWAEIGEIQTLLNWIAEHRALSGTFVPETSDSRAMSLVRDLAAWGNERPHLKENGPTPIGHLLQRADRLVAGSPVKASGRPQP